MLTNDIPDDVVEAAAEDAWEVIDRVRDAYPRIPNDAPTDEIVEALVDAGLLATARTRPTRDDIARALIVAAQGEAGGRAWDAPGPHGRTHWYAYADAVLALLDEIDHRYPLVDDDFQDDDPIPF